MKYMSGENNLEVLLTNMDPVMRDVPYVFLTAKEDFSRELQNESVMIFRESEGTTIIIEDRFISQEDSDTPRWAMITLNIHSDLAAVGFLAAISRVLAGAGISLNAVSAFYHDHLFVPWERKDEAMRLLKSF